MEKIVPPIRPQDHGPAVANLQEALLLFLNRGLILAREEGARREVSTALQREHTEQIYGEGTRKLVGIFQEERNLEGHGEVNESTANALNRLLDELGDQGDEQPEFTVKGRVRLFDGSPAAGIQVSAFDRDLRDEQELGQSQTDKQGFYQIGYTAGQFLKAERGNADLVVKAFAANGSLLATSPVLFNAPVVAETNLTVPAELFQPPTLFEKIARELPPLTGDLKVEELEEDKEHQDLSFLSGETGIEKRDLARFVLAHRLAREDLQAEFWFVLLGGSFYQFGENQSLKEQMAGILDALPSLDAAAVRKALTRGFNQKEIPDRFRENVAAWIEEFLKFIARRTVSGSGQPSFVKLALDDAGIADAQKQETFARLFNEHRALTPELLAALEEDGSFNKPEIADLRTSFRLADLTQSDFSVVKAIKEEFRIREPEKVRTLAKKDEKEWVNLVKTKYDAGELKLPIEAADIGEQVKLPAAEVYGKMLERQFREGFPTTAFAGRLERALHNGGARGLRQAEELARFLEAHENFEFLNTPVDDFFEKSIRRGFKALAKNESFRLEVKTVQRVFKLAPNFAATDSLLAADLHSAQKVYRMGKSEFVRQYGKSPGFTPETALLAWNRAADTHAAVLTIIGDLNEFDAGILPGVLKSGSPALENFPNWNNLFKTGDLCECEHCRSVLSPAAYFADLLMFLKDRMSSKPKNGDFYSVKDILFDRRLDLGYIELNCANALTPFPYVDTVCEVLEDAVDNADENDLELAGLNAIATPPTAADKAAVATAFQNAFDAPVNNGKEQIKLGADFSLSQVSPSDPNRWVVHGDDVTYLLRKNGASPNFFAKILRNTKASAAELRAYPEYVNLKAYDKLRAANYPMALPLDLFPDGDARRLEQRARSFALPFDLFAEEVRAGFQKCNLQRWDLMRTLRGNAAPNNPTDGEIAAEYFGISADPSIPTPTNPSDPTDEKGIILTVRDDDAWQQVFWGETGANWLNDVGNVKNFLQKTGLEYNELLAALDLKFLNPAGDISVHHLDASCDLDQKVIQVIDKTKLDRIHRFLRMWRKLKGWKMWELDLVIRHPLIGNGALDEPFLVNLFYFNRLKNRLGGKTTIEQVCALFGDLNTETRFTKLHEKREDALYQKLFLNKRLIKPLDPAFEVAKVDVPGPTTEQIPTHHPVVLAVLGIREADLVLIDELTKASDGTGYISGDLTLSNLSFLWRHAWLSKLLKFKAEEWKTILKIFQQDILNFATPKAAWEFVERVDQLKAAGFAPDELNWLLAADRSAKASTKETDVARFLTALRKDLQGIQAEYDPAQYAFLTATPPTDVDSLTALLSSLLQKLNRDEAEVNVFLKTLRGRVTLEASVEGLPAGFAFPGAITVANHIPIQYDEPAGVLRIIGILTAAERAILLNDASLAPVKDGTSYQNSIASLFQQSAAAADNFVSVDVALPGGVTLPADRPSLPIRYNSSTQKLTFIGVMTDFERLALNAVGNPAAVVDELFRIPRLAIKFFEPVFTAPLKTLSSAIDFKAQLSADLAAKISYDVEQGLLRFAGIMTNSEQAALNALVPNVLPSDVAYHVAVNSLAFQPQAIVAPDDRIWLTDNDIDPTLPANNTLAKRLANAAKKGLNYLSKTLAAGAVVQQSSAQLGLTEELTRRLLEDFAVIPDPANASLLAHLTRVFAAPSSGGVVDYATQKTTFDGWYWANRAAAILKKWKLTLLEFEKIVALTPGAQLLDFLTLPLDDTGTIASIARFLRTSRLLRMRDTLPEAEVTFLEVLEKLSAGKYATATDFGGDVELLNETWLTLDVEQLIASLDLAYPIDYLLAESWERLRRAFYFLDNLNAGADVVKTFAAAVMADAQTKTLKELLRSNFGEETWLTLSAEIQDTLRERKRDALVAYLLTRAQPADAPSGKWENTNDLYAYYLLDVEMSSCQLTSRLVQGSGSIQLFVQRCFMGLEPDVEVKASGDDGDSAWRWWNWMRKYRVWEANRKVFLWPENWIEPELKKDRSQFFKDLENELLQNEINQYTVETAFTNYLEKLDGVAQLEIAGFYQEDDGDNAIVHVFGRTKGAEPHLYYYRRYDYRQWTSWEKVDLEIQGNYLIPAVVNNRLFLFWPVFTEVPDEETNSESVPIPSSNETEASVKPAYKRLRLQMAVSDYRQGKWTPKRISKDTSQSNLFIGEILKNRYRFIAVDGSTVDGHFWIRFEGASERNVPDNTYWAGIGGSFDLEGCKGTPELTDLFRHFRNAIRPEEVSAGPDTMFSRWVELGSREDQQNDFTLQNYSGPSSPPSFPFTPVLIQTPDIFRMTPPWHLSFFDKLWLDGLLVLPLKNAKYPHFVPIGIWLPFFYSDKKRTFFVLPSLNGDREDRHYRKVGRVRKYYPEIKRLARESEEYLEGQVQTWLNGIDFSALPPSQRQQLEEFLQQRFEDEVTPPYSDDQLKNLMKRFVMRFFHLYLGALVSQLSQFRQFHFKNFYHPFVCDFAKLVYNPLKGIPALMSRETQLKNTGFNFHKSYKPTAWVVEPPTEEFYPKEVVDFTPDGAYSPYNWELFFHAPLLIANSLSRNQRFEEARNWYHFIFNPIGVESTIAGGSLLSKYWITKPFFQTTDPQYVQQRIDNILRMLSEQKSGPNQPLTDLEKQVLDWRTYPFEPHRIANYRTVAYQKTVVMKYLDNLVAWGDNLFRQDSMESINEATQLYIMAAEILGPRPKKIPPQAKPPLESFNELEDEFDKFSNALVEVENLIPLQPGNGPDGADPAPLPMLYFCIPQNDKMLGYWDTVADRLYKIRHCMNIEGVVRQLALFEPPIDPAALVKAVAAGIDISSALADLNAPLPLYRFNVLLQKANEVCNDVKALGSALLAALEKRDAEALSLLRQSQEITLQEAVTAVRQKQIDEAKQNLDAAKNSKELAEIKKNYYESQEFMNLGEIVAISLNTASAVLDIPVSIGHIAGGALKAIPNFLIGASGFGGSPHASAQTGGHAFGDAAKFAAEGLAHIARNLEKMASLSSTLASYTRRQNEWDFQRDLAAKEIEQIDKSIAAAELRIAIAEQELANHNLQIVNAKAVDTFMRSKYTNQDLYQWQVGQISGTYFQSYRLAYDLAKRAERCCRFELGLQDSSYINFGYWDSLKKGLLSGEMLQYDLRRLETAYIEQNRREFELTKHISLVLLDPLALVKLRETGRCFFRLPEEIFDLDYPGHYFRRIKSVSLTLPCVTGPYTTISCTLRLLKNSVRVNTANGENGYPHNTDDQDLPSDDDRFIENNIPVKAITASNAQNDSGVFELSFRDERYLPFEGAGVISDWSLELFSDLPSNNPDPTKPDFGRPLRQFDYSTISDAILHIKYAAREDAGPFKNGAIAHLRDYFSQDGATPSVRAFNLRHEFSSQWYRFQNPADPAKGNVFELEMSPGLFAFRDDEKTLKVNSIWLLARCKDGENYTVVLNPPLAPPPPGADTFKLVQVNQYGRLHFAQKPMDVTIDLTDPTAPPVKWQIRMANDNPTTANGNLENHPAEVEDVLLVLGYNWV